MSINVNNILSNSSSFLKKIKDNEKKAILALSKRIHKNLINTE